MNCDVCNKEMKAWLIVSVSLKHENGQRKWLKDVHVCNWECFSNGLSVFEKECIQKVMAGEALKT